MRLPPHEGKQNNWSSKIYKKKNKKKIGRRTVSIALKILSELLDLKPINALPKIKPKKKVWGNPHYNSITRFSFWIICSFWTTKKKKKNFGMNQLIFLCLNHCSLQERTLHLECYRSQQMTNIRFVFNKAVELLIIVGQSCNV